MIVGYDSRTGEGELTYEEALWVIHTSRGECLHHPESNQWKIDLHSVTEEELHAFHELGIDPGETRNGTLWLHPDGWELTKPGV